MQKLYFLLIGLLLFSCQKPTVETSPAQAKQQSEAITAALTSTRTIGDPNRTPNMNIPEREPGWFGYASLGLWDSHKRLEVAADGSVRLAYDCFIANGEKNAPLPFTFDVTGAKDFVSCRSCDGILDSTSTSQYDLKFPGMISIRLFNKGEWVGESIKQRFFVAPNYEREGFPWRSVHPYGSDTMVIYWGTADNYFNKITIPSTNSLPIPDQYVVQVKVNPDGAIRESNYDDNVSVLPVNISGMDVVTDLSAIAANAPKVITDLAAVYSGKGKYKTVTLTWTSKSEEFCVQRDGVMVKKDVYSLTKTDGKQTYIDTLAGGWKGSTYKILAENEGMGKTFSTPVTITPR